MVSFVTFLSLKFWFHNFYILVPYQVFGKHKLGSFNIGQIGKTAFTAEFLTAPNTLERSWTPCLRNLLKMSNNRLKLKTNGHLSTKISHIFLAAVWFYYVKTLNYANFEVLAVLYYERWSIFSFVVRWGSHFYM